MSQLYVVASIGALSMDKGAGVPDLTEYKFPAEFTLKSYALFNLSLPEVGAFVRPGCSINVKIKSRDDLERMIHSVGQIAFLNSADRLLDICVSKEKEEIKPVAPTVDDKPEEVAGSKKQPTKASKSQKKEGK